MPVTVIRTAWSGTSGGPGLTQMFVGHADFAYLTPAIAQASVNAVRAFWDAIKATIPNEITLTVSPVMDIYNEVNGDLTGSISAATPPASVAGTDAGAYSMPTGMKINLNTGTIRDKRRVRGAIYIVPASGIYSLTGNILSTARTTVNTAAETMRAALNGQGVPLVVYSRERKATAQLPQRNGAYTVVSALETNEKAAILRGRRD